MSAWVLDASALLAYLWQEPGHETVAHRIEQSTVMMSSVNLSEVLSRAWPSTRSQSTLSPSLRFRARRISTGITTRPPSDIFMESISKLHLSDEWHFINLWH